MSTEKHNKSIELWKEEQKTLISVFELNIDYLEKEIELKQRLLEQYRDSLAHEKKFLDDYNNAYKLT